MIYSCFNEAAGMYRVYQDRKEHAINADLPVPSLPVGERIGTAATEAGRPFPNGAEYVGDSWNARGVVVRCPGSLSLGAFSLESVTLGGVLILGAAALVGWFAGKKLGRWT